MDLKSVLLGFLTRGDLTGYELKRAMDESVGFFFGASYGSIYPALKELESGGLVSSTRIIQSERPNKKVYSLTPEGQAYFKEQLETTPLSGGSLRSDFHLRLFFGAHQEPEKLLEYVDEYRSLQRANLERLRATEEEVENIATPYELMCLRFGLAYYESTLSWLDGVEEEIREEMRAPIDDAGGAR